LWCSKCFITWLWIICSNIFEARQVRDIDYWSVIFWVRFFPSFKNSTYVRTFPFGQMSALMSVKIGEISFAYYFRNHAGILSGPEALLICRDIKYYLNTSHWNLQRTNAWFWSLSTLGILIRCRKEEQWVLCSCEVVWTIERFR
jgi:hypothetical protein